MKKSSKLALVAVSAIIALVASAVLALRGVGWWIDSSDRPAKSDILVVLSGDYARPLFAAELYAQGFAPEVWLSRPRRLAAMIKLDAIGIHLPGEEAVYRQILVKGGVPDARIHEYGRGVNSTADEAEALRLEYPPAGKKILVVTSRFHARRARLIFDRALPEAELRVVAAPYETANPKWWTDKEFAQNAVMETLKTVYFMLGGRMK